MIAATRAECGFCGESRDPAAMVRGGKSFICAACLSDGVTWSIASRGSGVGPELPEADRPCSFCSKKSPASALFTKHDGSICPSCLARGFWFFANTAELDQRRQTWRFLDNKSPASILDAHFDGVAPSDIVTSSRRFAQYMQVDLNRTLERLMPEDARCIGIHQQWSHDTLSFATLSGKDDRIGIAPLQYDEVDVGDDEPARCLKKALWLAKKDGTPYALLFTPEQKYGEASGWIVEIAVPPGERGGAVVRGHFKAIEEAMKAAAAYRGKVLSLEASRRAEGTGALVTVHRLAAVSRADVVLPSATLELLERNVFKFAEHRRALAEMGLPVKKGLLFYGPPGTGKTHTIRYLASALTGHTTLLVTAEQVALIDHYMILARLLAPSILVIEDADLIARQREEMNGPCEEVLLNRLLNEMDGLKEGAEILFVLTTNRPEALEMALRARPGRINQSIEFPFPDAEGRLKLATLYGKGAPLAGDTLAHVVERTDKVSAAFIKELMRRSTQFALERTAGGGAASEAAITRADVDLALDEMLFSGGRLNAALLGAAEAGTSTARG